MATEHKFQVGDIVALDKNSNRDRDFAADHGAKARVTGYNKHGNVCVIWIDTNTSHSQSDGDYIEHYFTLVNPEVKAARSDVVKTKPGVYLALDGKKYSSRCKAQAVSQAYRTIHKLDEDKPREIKVGDTVRFKETSGNDSYNKLLGKTAVVTGKRTVNSGKVFLDIRWVDVHSNLLSWYEERFELVGPTKIDKNVRAKAPNKDAMIARLEGDLARITALVIAERDGHKHAEGNLAVARGQLAQSGKANTDLTRRLQDALVVIKDLKKDIKLLQAKVGINDIIIVNRRHIAL